MKRKILEVKEKSRHISIIQSVIGFVTLFSNLNFATFKPFCEVITKLTTAALI